MIMPSQQETCNSSATACASCGTKSVSFADKATARWMLHINDYTEQQKRMAFYNAREINAITMENRETLRKMQKKQSIDETHHLCTRGLERHLKEESRLRKKHQRTVVHAVLLKQEAYYTMYEGGLDVEDIPIDDIIASLYASLTAPSKESAYITGLADAKAVQVDDDEEEEALRKEEGEQQAQRLQDKKNLIPHQSRRTASTCRRMVTLRMKQEQNSSSFRRQIVNSAA